MMLERCGRTRFGLVRFLIMCGLLAAGACTVPGDERSQLPSVHQPQAQVVQFRHTVRFPDGNGRLDQVERERLDEFLSKTDPGDADTVFVAAGYGDPKVVERRRQTVAAYLDMRKVEARLVSPEAVAQPPVGENVDVVVNRYLVTLPGCPDWTAPSGINWTNTSASNWGCATAVNLGMMLANPGDLEVGRDAGPMDGEAAVLGIQRYRAGETKAVDPSSITGLSGGSN